MELNLLEEIEEQHQPNRANSNIFSLKYSWLKSLKSGAILQKVGKFVTHPYLT